MTHAPALAPDRRALFRLLATAAGLLVGLLAAELGVRAYAKFGGPTGRRLAVRDPLAVIYEPFGNFGYRQKPGKVETFPNGTRAVYNSMAYRGPLVRVEKPPEVRRLILLGGSTAIGYGVNDDDTIAEHMRRMLHARFPGTCFEVVNLALGGYDSYQDYERLRVDGMRLSPDIVIIHSGINDVRNAQFAALKGPPDPRTLMWEGEMRRIREASKLGPRLRALTLHYSYLARLPGLIGERQTQRAGLHVIQVVEPHDDAVGYFRTNVERTVELSLQAGARVLLSKPPSAIPIRNKPGDPVEKSYWIKDAATTEAYRDRLAAVMADVSSQHRAKGHEVSYVTHALALEQYIDDAHLNAAGNEAVARGLVGAVIPLLPGVAAASPSARAACAAR